MTTIIVPVLGWLAFFIAAFVVPQYIEPTGEGFTRGTNRLPYVLGLHLAAVGLALAAAWHTRVQKKSIPVAVVWVGYAPLVSF
jgi:hypothetical protein